VLFKHIYYKLNVITADPDDDKFFDAAVACNADYLDFGRTMDLLNHK
jgi:hypothetical protein